MPHYSDGTEARVGDVVRGKGYNIRDLNDNLKEIVGTIVHITPGASACNVNIAVTEIRDLNFDSETIDYNEIGALMRAGVQLVGKIDTPGAYSWPSIRIEYGQADHFEKIL